MSAKTFFTASEARKNFYQLIRKTSQGEVKPEIYLQGTQQPVVMISREEYESWLETLDILENQEELTALKASERESINSAIPLKKVARELGLEDENQNPAKRKKRTQ